MATIGNLIFQVVPPPEVEYEEAICWVETAEALIERIDRRKACRTDSVEANTAIADALDLAYLVMGTTSPMTQAEMVARARVLARVAEMSAEQEAATAAWYAEGCPPWRSDPAAVS